MNFEGLLANSEGQSLIEHSKSVANLAVIKACKMFSYCPPELKEIIYLSALLHDIGKNSNYQKLFIGENIKFQYPHHHLISYAIFCMLFTPQTFKQFYPTAYSILYHHSPPKYIEKGKKIKTYTNTQEIIGDVEDAKNCFLFAQHLLSECKEYFVYYRKVIDNALDVVYEDVCDICQNLAPIYSIYPLNADGEINKGSDNKSAYYDIIRASLIWADRMVSSSLSMEGMQDKGFDIETFSEHFIPKEVEIPEDFKERFYQLNHPEESQRAVIDAIKAHRNVLIKAPCGWGKTVPAAIYSVETGKRLIVACPENSIAQSDFNNFCELSKKFGGFSVELILANKRVKATGNAPKKPFSAQVIVTNIDSIIAPSYKFNRNTLDVLYDCDIFFDEIHVLMENPQLFAFVLELIKVRTKNTDKKNIFSTATPDGINKYWDAFFKTEDKTVVLPEEGRHYESFNNKPINVTVTKKYPDPIPGSFGYHNYTEPVINAETVFHVHSYFKKEHKQLVVEKVQETFRSGDAIETASFCRVGENAMNISTRDISMAMSVFKVVLQRMGRGNRYGEKDSSNVAIVLPEYYVSKSNELVLEDRSEAMIWNMQYSKALLKINLDFWLTEVGENKTKQYTINQLYLLYNQFLKANEKVIEAHFKKVLNIGYEMLRQFNPFKIIYAYDNELSDDDNDVESIEEEIIGLNEPTAGSYSLRCPERQYLTLIRCPTTDTFIVNSMSYEELCYGYGYGQNTHIGSAKKEYVERKYTITKATCNAWIKMIEASGKYKKLLNYLKSKKNKKSKNIVLNINELLNMHSKDFPFIDLCHIYDQKDEGNTFESVGRGILKAL